MTPVHQEVLTLSREERKSIEESGDAPGGTAGRDLRDASWNGDIVGLAPPTDKYGDHLYVLASPLAEAAADAIFAVADVFAHEKVSDGWDEIV